jgi:hypothetical protein
MTARRGLLGNASGVSTVEFAVIAPLMALMATLGVSALHLHGGLVTLEMAVARATRAAAVGAAIGGETRLQAVRRIVTEHVCPEGGGFCYWDPEWLGRSDDDVVGPVAVTALAYGDPRNIGRPEPFTDLPPFNGVFDPGETYVDVNGDGRWNADMGASGLGGSGEYVVYEVRMAQKVTHPILAPLLGAQMVRRAQMVIQNEPF